MQRYYVILGILFFNTSFSQEIELKGKFGASFIGGETIEFVGKDSFYFSGFYCTFGQQGKGRCEIIDNFLYLYFEKAKIKPLVDSTRKPMITKEDNSGGMRSIKVFCFYDNNEPAQNVTVKLLRDNKMIDGAFTDDQGQVSFRAYDTDHPLIIETAAAGMKSQLLAIDKSSNYSIRIFLRENDWLNPRELNNGETRIYEIDELTKDMIMMRPANSKGSFRKYIRKKD